MTNETKMPDALQQAYNACSNARDAIRAAHTKRRDQQHNAADLAQRAADLEAERDELRARLAELEQQEPVATAWIRTRAPGVSAMANAFPWPPYKAGQEAEHWKEKGYHEEPLYARPVPAIPAGWKPIESAPKNGTAVLSLLAGSDVAHSVRWLESGHKFANGTAGWHIVWDLSRVSLQDGPDYWMPIPTAPEAAQ